MQYAASCCHARFPSATPPLRSHLLPFFTPCSFFSLLPQASRTQTMAEAPIAQSPYLTALDEGSEAAAAAWREPQSWTDYLRCYLHPRSVNVVKRFAHNDEAAPFDSFWQGEACSVVVGPVSARPRLLSSLWTNKGGAKTAFPPSHAHKAPSSGTRTRSFSRTLRTACGRTWKNATPAKAFR